MKKYLLLLAASLPLVLSCTKEEETKLTVNPESIALYSKGSSQITTNATDATFDSEDEFYAEVDATGKVTANKVGSTNIVVSGNGKTFNVPVEVMPKYTLFPDLDAFVGKSKVEVVYAFGSNYTPDKTKDGKEVIVYKNYNSYSAFIMFTFEGSVVANVSIAVPTKNTSQLTDSLIERYSVAGTLNDVYFFLNHDKNVILGLQVYSASYLMVIYLPYTSSKSAEFPEINAKAIIGDIAL